MTMEDLEKMSSAIQKKEEQKEEANLKRKAEADGDDYAECYPQ